MRFKVRSMDVFETPSNPFCHRNKIEYPRQNSPEYGGLMHGSLDFAETRVVVSLEWLLDCVGNHRVATDFKLYQ